MAVYYDNRHIEAPDFKKGEKVFLLRQNIKTKRLNQKLDHIRLGPFIIEKRLRLVNYRLQLLKSMKVHNAFYVLLLEAAPKYILILGEIELDEDIEQEYDVEEILDEKKVSG